MANNGEFFGISVSISGNYSLIGASGDDTNGTNSGAVYVYKRSETSWSFYQKLIPHSSSAFDEFVESNKVDSVILWQEYQEGKQTYAQLSKKHNCSKRIISTSYRFTLDKATSKGS